MANKVCIAIAVIIAIVVIVAIIIGVAVGVPCGSLNLCSGTTASSGTDVPDDQLGQTFHQCCAETAKKHHFSQTWKATCISLQAGFLTAFNTLNYDSVVAELKVYMEGETSALFWSTMSEREIETIVSSIASSSPPSSFNTPAGALGNCISGYLQDNASFRSKFHNYWISYSKTMAKEATGYVFWLTSGDRSSSNQYFPESMMRQSFWQQYELPNLSPQAGRVSGVVVLNARSSSSSAGLTCSSDTQSKDNLVSVNNQLKYFCCDLALNQNAVLGTINTVLSGMCKY